METHAGGTALHLQQMDCVAGMAAMEPNSVDVIVTSPPYNLGIDYSQYDDKKTKAAYLEWTGDWARAARRVLREDGSLFLNIAGSPSNPLLPHEVALRMGEIFVLQNTIHWIKSITVKTLEGREISAGHFKPINSKRFINDCHEYVFHLTKTGARELDRRAVGVEYVHKSNIGRWSHSKGVDKRCRGNTWHIPYKTIKSREKDRPHPASFPVELPIQCIRLHGWRADLVVMDPFLGIGSSALAAQRTKVGAFFGFEIDPEYLATARDRLREETGGLLDFD